jgi:sarcosine oxidase
MDTDVVVVGGGVMGLSTAWRLAIAGTSVALVERFDVGHNRGSSHGATRVFRFLYDDALYIRMAQRSLPLWRELEAETGVELLRMTGGLHVDAPPVLERFRDVMAGCGAGAEMLSAEDRRERYPWLAVEDDRALFVPDLGVIAADKCLHALRELCLRLGVDVREHRIVEAIEPSSDEVDVVTSSGSVRARSVVVAAGGWANDLLGLVGLRIPLRVTREQVHYFRSDHQILPFVHGGDHFLYAVPPLVGDLVKVAEHGTGPETTAEDRDLELEPGAAARIDTYVRDTLPTLEPQRVGFETCLYATTPDGDFVLDARDGVIVVSTCSGHGFKFAPLVGEIAACLATGREPPFDIARFSLGRF